VGLGSEPIRAQGRQYFYIKTSAGRTIRQAGTVGEAGYTTHAKNFKVTLSGAVQRVFSLLHFPE
jgi:hypothetical protein